MDSIDSLTALGERFESEVLRKLRLKVMKMMMKRRKKRLDWMECLEFAMIRIDLTFLDEFF